MDLTEIYNSIQKEMVKKELTEKQRKIYEMYAYENLTQYEIAEKMGITQSQVSSSLKRCVEILSKRMKYVYMFVKLTNQRK